MTHIEKQTLSIRHHLSSILGETTAKSYFSYYGIFKDGFMFGLYKDHKFYLKVPQKHLETMQFHNLEKLRDPKLSGTKMYYLIPSHIMNNLTHYHQWFIDSLEEAKQLKQQIHTAKQQFIRSLPNMNLSLERTLKKVDIHTIDDLIKRGEVNVFVDLIKLGIDVDSTFLFKLYGAVNHKLIYALSPEQKNTILREADIALYNSRLRKRFTTN